MTEKKEPMVSVMGVRMPARIVEEWANRQWNQRPPEDPAENERARAATIHEYGLDTPRRPSPSIVPDWRADKRITEAQRQLAAAESKRDALTAEQSAAMTALTTAQTEERELQEAAFESGTVSDRQLRAASSKVQKAQERVDVIRGRLNGANSALARLNAAVPAAIDAAKADARDAIQKLYAKTRLKLADQLEAAAQTNELLLAIVGSANAQFPTHDGMGNRITDFPGGAAMLPDANRGPHGSPGHWVDLRLTPDRNGDATPHRLVNWLQKVRG